MCEAGGNEYLECFQIQLLAMKVFGIFPFIFSHRGTSKRLFLSRVLTLITITLYLTLLQMNVIYVGQNIVLLMRNFDYNLLLRVLPPIVIRFHQLIVPFISWNKSKLMHEHWENWRKFQNKLEKLKGVKYSSPVRRKVIWIPNAVVSCLIVFTVLGKPYYDKSVVIPPSYFTLLHASATSTIILYWYANCLYVKSVSREIIRLITKAVRSKKDKNICDLTALWLNLDELNDEFNAIHSILFLVTFLNAAFSAAALFYSFLNLTFLQLDNRTGFTFLANACICVAVLALFCECGDSLLKTMVNGVKETILVQNTITIYGKPLRSIVIFLSLIEARKSKITFNGFMTVNRTATITCISVIINYLIILRQFDKRK